MNALYKVGVRWNGRLQSRTAEEEIYRWMEDVVRVLNQ